MRARKQACWAPDVHVGRKEGSRVGIVRWARTLGARGYVHPPCALGSLLTLAPAPFPLAPREVGDADGALPGVRFGRSPRDRGPGSVQGSPEPLQHRR